ncbi:poly [ADP-ribose] polymerase tankyrase-1-like [Coccinella septempunctata]|uniref:poly [ADP-ribose] polymerase tankyrase-1-like n=1 Tax=Coccinella septempunctata TaxID=41139 RepID=UPI001D088E90|nr:poly [ADP-ribose] polymerase tankyrase-1-like [Coccinella septempunctata]
MRKFLEMGASVHGIDKRGYTCLHQAVLCGKYTLIKHLVEYGANVEQNSFFPMHKPIHLCARVDYEEDCLKELLKCGAQPNAVDFLKNTLLHVVLMYAPYKRRYIQKLVTKYGMDPKATNIRGDNALHIIVGAAACTPRDILFLAKIFMKRGVDINSVNIFGETPLHVASRNGHPSVVDFLLREGAAMGIRSNTGWTAFELLVAEDYRMMDPIVIFLKHFALKKRCGETLEDSVSQIITSDVKFQKIYRKFENDLNRLQSTQIVETHRVTVHDILCCKKSEVVIYLRSACVRDNIVANKDSTFFWREIRHRFSKIMKIIRLEEESCRLIHQISYGRLPYPCLEHISKYLSERDVKVLSSSLRTKNRNRRMFKKKYF